MKAWAILCVVMGHVIIFNLYGAKNDSLLFGLIYSFHLPIFAFASGLVTDVEKFKFSKRMKIVYPLFIFGIPFTYMIGKDLAYFINDDMKCGYWYLWMMPIFYVCLYLMHRLKMNVLTGFIVFELIFQLLLRCLHDNVINILCLRSCAGLWPWLCLGMFFRQSTSLKMYLTGWWKVLSLGFLWLLSFSLNSEIHIKGLHYIISLLGVMFFISLFCTFDSKGKFKMGGVKWGNARYRFMSCTIS